MKIEFQANNAENYLISVAAEEETHVKMGMCVPKLVCLVPIQIARAKNNAMVALKDGLQIPHYISYVDSISLANSIRFGFYDAVLNSWKGKIKVISSMGKQSSGKSYLLNHLSGSLLDVAGGRCTDGVWMKITTGEDGDGQGDNSEQEDMLLSVLNAAVSNLTIFNKKDFHLDKDTESAFSRFHSGINLLKQDKKLFKGLFYIAIKDVDTSDVRDLQQEFLEKISQICSKSQDNFIFKIKRVAVIVDILRRNLMSSVHTGCLSANANEELQVFVIFDTQEEIPDSPIFVGDLSCDIKDSGLYLTPSNDSLLFVTIREVLSQLRSSLELVLPRKGRNGEEWHSMFENFLESLAERRQDRVQKWISANTVEFSDNDVVQRLQLEASVALGKVKQGLSVCGCKCSVCFWRCVLEKGHIDDHSCMSSHSCAES
ncbi:hypothetical protein KI387_037470 [Taxus chinensis]|uniref:VLIG-type G domain-containing protein n=1 Tax=Taxus chinensis TaxID=29808 RepID=A0AA38KVK3_TAXCH|nr:hypothetical protein KI387_037470 [Taxus chinensis]